MADKPASPFSGLDKALMRSTTKPTSSAEELASQEEAESSTRRSKLSVDTSVQERTNAPSFERTNERIKVRHSFDIYRDQLLELADLQAAIFRSTGKKPKVGELVQEALDAYLNKQRRRTQ